MTHYTERHMRVACPNCGAQSDLLIDTTLADVLRSERVTVRLACKHTMRLRVRGDILNIVPAGQRAVNFSDHYTE